MGTPQIDDAPRTAFRATRHHEAVHHTVGERDRMMPVMLRDIAAIHPTALVRAPRRHVTGKRQRRHVALAEIDTTAHPRTGIGHGTLAGTSHFRETCVLAGHKRA